MEEVEIRRLRRSKYVRITIRDEASILVTAPKTTPKYFIQAFLAEKKEWIRRQKEEMAARSESILADHSKEQFKKYKKEALKIAKKKVRQWNALYQYNVGDIRVKRMRTQWGSCSSKQNLNFNYKIYFLPEELQDYLVVHEICHLKEMNHSPRFWKLVEQAVPDYQKLRKTLRQLK